MKTSKLSFLYYSFHLLCAFGALFQIYKVSEMFFSFQTTVDIKVERNESYEMPVVSLCFWLTSIANRTAIEERYSNFTLELDEIQNGNGTDEEKKDDIKSRQRKYVTNIADTPKKRNELTYDFEHLFEYCGFAQQVTVNGSQDIVYNNNCSHNVYYIYLRKCFTFFERNNGQEPALFIDRKVAESRGMDTMVYFDFRVGHHPEFAQIIISDPEERRFADTYNNMVAANIKSNDYVDISYSIKTNILLKHPYPTNCTNYTTVGYKSRNDCIQRCLIKENAKFKKWPGSIPASPDIDLPFAYDQRDCPQKCSYSEDCEKKHFYTKFDNFNDINGYRMKLIAVKMPSDIWTTFTHNPKLQLVEYLCYVGSAVSLWFGVSVVGLFTEYPTKYAKVVNRTVKRVHAMK